MQSQAGVAHPLDAQVGVLGAQVARSLQGRVGELAQRQVSEVVVDSFAGHPATLSDGRRQTACRYRHAT